MKVLVCGDRDWDDGALIRAALAEHCDKSDTLIHGDCRGADKIAGSVGKRMGMNVIPVPADWNRYGKRAGPIRNTEMLHMQPDLVLAFHNDIKSSKGTKDMLTKARKAGVQCVLYTSKGIVKA